MLLHVNTTTIKADLCLNWWRSKVSFSHLLAIADNMLHSLRTFTTGVLRDLFDVVEQNGKDSWACVNHKSYFKHLTKNMFKSLFLLIIRHSTKSFLQMYYLFATVAHLCWLIESLGEDLSSRQKLCSNMWCWNILGFAPVPLIHRFAP